MGQRFQISACFLSSNFISVYPWMETARVPSLVILPSLSLPMKAETWFSWCYQFFASGCEECNPQGLVLLPEELEAWYRLWTGSADSRDDMSWVHLCGGGISPCACLPAAMRSGTRCRDRRMRWPSPNRTRSLLREGDSDSAAGGEGRVMFLFDSVYLHNLVFLSLIMKRMKWVVQFAYYVSV